MPPPMSSASTRGSRLSMTSILSETLAPPSTATNGPLAGAPRAMPRYRSSFSISRPATRALHVVGDALGRGVRAVRAAERVVHEDRGARCPRSAAAANAASFASSSVWKRTFSSSSTPPSRQAAGQPLHLGAHAVGRHRDRRARAARARRAPRRAQAELAGRALLRPPEVRGQHQRARPAPEQVARAWAATARMRVSSVMRAALERDVEVHAHEHARSPAAGPAGPRTSSSSGHRLTVYAPSSRSRSAM